MWAAAIFALAVLGVLLLVWMGQRTLIYFPDRAVPSPAVTGLPGVEAVQIPAADGVTLRAWFLPSRSQPPSTAVIVFNGNAGNRAYRSSLAAALGGLGLSVLLFDYRGFGDSDGSPTERGLHEDARAVRRYLAGRSDVRADRLVYFGESLGTAVAVRLAVEHPPAAMILRSPFTSLVDVGRLHYPILPVRWLLRDRFSSIDAIGSVRSPVLIVAGDRDRIVPLEQSRELFERTPEPRELVVVPGADHNDAALMDGRELIDAVRRFLERYLQGNAAPVGRSDRARELGGIGEETKRLRPMGLLARGYASNVLSSPAAADILSNGRREQARRWMGESRWERESPCAGSSHLSRASFIGTAARGCCCSGPAPR